MNYYPSYSSYYGQQQTPKIGEQYSSYVPQQYVPQYKPTNMIQGKSVDSLEVVKAMDIPLDRKRVIFPINRWNGNSI